MSTAPITVEPERTERTGSTGRPVEPERPPGGDDSRFSAAVAAVAAAFGDPTRRDIFLHVRAVPGRHGP